MLTDLTTALVIAPHPDDEVLGCGGTMAALAAAGVSVHVLVVSADVPPLYSAEVAGIVEAEARTAHRLLGVGSTCFLDHPSVELARMPVAELNHGIEEAVKDLRPELVLAPFPDRHLDHKAVFEAAMVATRPVGAGSSVRTLALYETVSETHWNVPGVEANFVPDWFVDVSDHLGTKLQSFGAYVSQVQDHPGPRSLRALESLASFRGSQVGLELAEAFCLVRSITRFDAAPGHAGIDAGAGYRAEPR
jgi:N-acetylglucosamine malate deacetylase 1